MDSRAGLTAERLALFTAQQHGRRGVRSGVDPLMALDPDERQEMEDLFNQYNKSRTGELSLEEFTHLFQDLGLQDVEQAMKILDTNGTGTITKVEFMRWFFQPDTLQDNNSYTNSNYTASDAGGGRGTPSAGLSMADQMHQVEENFDKYDSGYKGYLNDRELDQFLTDFGVTDPHERMLAKATIDSDNDGRVTKDDVVNWTFGAGLGGVQRSAPAANMRGVARGPRGRSGTDAFSDAASRYARTSAGEYQTYDKLGKAPRPDLDKMPRRQRQHSIASAGSTLENMGEDQMTKLFGILDQDKDGQVDYREFAKAVQRIGLRWEKRKMMEVFGYMDTAGSRYVSYDQFRRAIYTDNYSLKIVWNRLLFEVDPEMDMDPDIMVDPKDIPKIDPEKMLKTLTTLKAEWEERIDCLHSLAEHCKRSKFEDPDKFHRFFKKFKEPFCTQLTDNRSAVIREACIALAKIAKSKKKMMQKYLSRFFDAVFACLRIGGVAVISASSHQFFKVVMKYVPDNKRHVLISELIKGTKDPKYKVVREKCYYYIVLLLNKARVTGRPTDQTWWDKIEAALRDGIKDQVAEVREEVYDGIIRLEFIYKDRAARICQRMSKVQKQRFEEKKDVYVSTTNDIGMSLPGILSRNDPALERKKESLSAFIEEFDHKGAGTFPVRDLNKIFKDLGLSTKDTEKKAKRVTTLLDHGKPTIQIAEFVEWWFTDPKLARLKIPRPGGSRQPTRSSSQNKGNYNDYSPRGNGTRSPGRGRRGSNSSTSSLGSNGRRGTRPQRTASSRLSVRPKRASRPPAGAKAATPRSNRYQSSLKERSHIQVEPVTPVSPDGDGFNNVLSEILEVRDVLAQVEGQIQSITSLADSYHRPEHTGHVRNATQDSTLSSASAKEKFQEGIRKDVKRNKKITRRAHRRMNSVRTQVEQVQKMVDKFDGGNKGYLTTLEIKRFLKDFGVGQKDMVKAVSTITRDSRGRSKKSQLVSWVINEAPQHDWGRWKQIVGFSNVVANLADKADHSGHSPRKEEPRSSPPRVQRPLAPDHEVGWRQLSGDQLGTRLQFYTYLLEVETGIGNKQATSELRNKIRIIEKLLRDKAQDPTQYTNPQPFTKQTYPQHGIIKTMLKGPKGKEVKDIIKKLRLLLAPQGGLYAENYRSSDAVFLPRHPRSSGTLGNSVHYLLEAENRCCWHRTASDQTWAFHRGCEVTVHTIDANGPVPTMSTARLGDVLSRNQARPQLQIKSGLYVSAELTNPNEYALISIHNFPAQDIGACAIPSSMELLRLLPLPQHRDLLRRLSKDNQT